MIEDISKLSRLPKWAQSAIKALECDLDKAESELKKLRENAPSNVSYCPDPVKRDRVFIPDDSIEFNVGGKWKNRTMIRVRLVEGKEGFIEVNGDDQLSVEPQASNHVRIRLNQD